MRKLLVIVLMLALVPFTTGCRIDGLWGFNDDEGTTTVVSSSKTLTPSITFAKDATISDQRAKILNDWAVTGSKLKIKAKADSAYVSMTAKTNSDGSITYTADSAITLSSTSVSGSNYVFTVSLTTATGQEFVFEITVPVTVKDGDVPAFTLSELVLTNTGFGFKFTVKFTITGATTTTETSGTGAATQTGTIPTTYVEKVTYAGTTTTAATTESVLSSTVTSNIDWTAPVFKVYFSKALTALPTVYSVDVQATDSTAKTKVSFSSSDNSLLTIEFADTTKKIVKITVKGQTGGMNKTLNPGTSYTITFNSATVGTETLASATYLIKTAPVKVASWKTVDAAGAALTGYDSTTSKVKASTAKGVSVTFDYAVALPTTTELSTAKFSMSVAGATATAQLYTTYFNTPTISSDKKTVTMMFKNNPIMKTGAHVITWDSSFTAKDLYGKALDTTTSISFTAE